MRSVKKSEKWYKYKSTRVQKREQCNKERKIARKRALTKRRNARSVGDIWSKLLQKEREPLNVPELQCLLAEDPWDLFDSQAHVILGAELLSCPVGHTCPLILTILENIASLGVVHHDEVIHSLGGYDFLSSEMWLHHHTANILSFILSIGDFLPDFVIYTAALRILCVRGVSSSVDYELLADMTRVEYGDTGIAMILESGVLKHAVVSTPIPEGILRFITNVWSSSEVKYWDELLRCAQLMQALADVTCGVPITTTTFDSRGYAFYVFSMLACGYPRHRQIFEERPQILAAARAILQGDVVQCTEEAMGLLINVVKHSQTPEIFMFDIPLLLRNITPQCSENAASEVYCATSHIAYRSSDAATTVLSMIMHFGFYDKLQRDSTSTISRLSANASYLLQLLKPNE